MRSNRFSRWRESKRSQPTEYPESWLYPVKGSRRRRLRRDVARAKKLGMRPGVFAKIGDSNMLAYNSFLGLGCREPVWGEHSQLRPVMERYRRVELPPGADIPFVHCPDAEDRQPWNSFSRVTAAGMLGITSRHLLTPKEEMDELPIWWRDDPARLPGENAIETELRIISPLYTFIQIGTNGQSFDHTTVETAAGVVEIVELVREFGSVPIVFNMLPQLNHEMVPARWEYAEYTGREMAAAMTREKVPFVNLWLPLSTDQFANNGLIEYDGEYFDGFHLETYGGFKSPDALQNSVDFSPEALRYGINFRNLLILKVLAELDEISGLSGT